MPLRESTGLSKMPAKAHPLSLLHRMDFYQKLLVKKKKKINAFLYFEFQSFFLTPKFMENFVKHHASLCLSVLWLTLEQDGRGSPEPRINR